MCKAQKRHGVNVASNICLHQNMVGKIDVRHLKDTSKTSGPSEEHLARDVSSGQVQGRFAQPCKIRMRNAGRVSAVSYGMYGMYGMVT